MFPSADHALLLIILNPYLHLGRGSRLHNHIKEVRYYYYIILIVYLFQLKTGKYRNRREWWQAFPELSACSYMPLRFDIFVTKYVNYQQISKHEFIFYRTRSFNVAPKDVRYLGWMLSLKHKRKFSFPALSSIHNTSFVKWGFGLKSIG